MSNDNHAHMAIGWQDAGKMAASCSRGTTPASAYLDDCARLNRHIDAKSWTNSGRIIALRKI